MIGTYKADNCFLCGVSMSTAFCDNVVLLELSEDLGLLLPKDDGNCCVFCLMTPSSLLVVPKKQ